MTNPNVQHEAVEALNRVQELADLWTKRGEHDMAFSKTVPDEDIAMVLLTEGATMVENARHIRNAIAGNQVIPAESVEAPHKITIKQLGDEGYERLMRLIFDITSSNGRAVVYVHPELKAAK